MTPDRAFTINSALAQAWLIREGLSNDRAPDLSSYTLQECLAASEYVAAAPAQDNGDGTRTLTCVVDRTALPELYIWALSFALRGGNGIKGANTPFDR